MKKTTYKITESEYGNIDPNKIKGWYFPNWFDKEHFETFLDLEIDSMSDKEFEQWKEFLCEETQIFDEISEVVQEYLQLNKKEFKKWKEA